MKTEVKSTAWTPMQPVPNPYEAMGRGERREAINNIYKIYKEMWKTDRSLSKPTKRQAKRQFKETCKEIFYANELYQATVDYSKWDAKSREGYIYISLKNHKRTTNVSWQHKQWIKNDICGEEMEAMELFPAESRLVNTANQYHLWVLDKIPFGFNKRIVSSADVMGRGKQTIENKGGSK